MSLGTKSKIIDSINKLKKEKNAVILAHCYQNIEIDEVADFVGDSLYLSRQAAQTGADIIVFAGVYFMAETAKILSPSKKVLLPRKEAGCLMADMINAREMKNFKEDHPDACVVCYVNSEAQIKAESDVCCTSSNAVKIVKSLPEQEIIFVPDRGLGAYIASQVPEKKITSYYGFCPTHMRILPAEIDRLKARYKNAQVLVHPECHMEVIKKADFVGSTSGIMNKVKQSHAQSFIIATERGVLERLQRDYPEKEFILASEKAICENMKWNRLEDILISLEKEVHEVLVEEETRKKAYMAIKKMLDLS